MNTYLAMRQLPHHEHEPIAVVRAFNPVHASTLINLKLEDSGSNEVVHPIDLIEVRTEAILLK
jgi:hypothetical protein